jgi:ADP-ribose pyrophosphatase
MNEIRIIRENAVYENAYGRLFDDEVEFTSSGTSGTYVRWQWTAPYSVAVLPVVGRDEVRLLNSFRHSARQNVTEAVKGFGRVNTPPDQSAREELEEELGLRAGRLEYLGEVVADPAFACHTMHLFIAWECVPVKARPEASEVIHGPQAFCLENVPEVLPQRRITDAVTILLLWESYYRVLLKR